VHFDVDKIREFQTAEFWRVDYRRHGHNIKLTYNGYALIRIHPLDMGMPRPVQGFGRERPVVVSFAYLMWTLPPGGDIKEELALAAVLWQVSNWAKRRSAEKKGSMGLSLASNEKGRIRMQNSKSATQSRCPPAKNAGEFLIGNDLRVTRLGFGAMRITGNGIWGAPTDRDEAVQVLRRAVELGIDFIDTADSYGPRVSEEIIAEALYPYPAQLVIATKGGFERPGPNRWVENGRPEHLRSACEGSLRRLRLDRIDLYQLHRIDPRVPAEDQLGTLKDLQAQGKIRHIGLSEVTVRQIRHAQTIVSIVSVQNRYNLADRGSEDVLEYCEKRNMGFIPWFPLGAGKVSAVDSPLSRLAAQWKATPSQVALAWLLARSPVLLPIPGTSSVAHLEENVAAAGLKIDKNRMRELALTA
jgi:aryl-alcohol dehydrogenase-like predicted oxidoreductase